MKTAAEVIGVEQLQKTAEDPDRSATTAGQLTRGRDQGGHRSVADLRLQAGPRHPQAAGRFR